MSETSQTPRVAVDIWSDVVCPWCAIGYTQFAKAMKDLDGEIDVEVRWMPFELNPDAPAEGKNQAKHLAEVYQRTPEQLAEMRANLEAVAERAGFSMAYDGPGDPPEPMMWNTFEAHKLLRWALTVEGMEAQTALGLALFRAHFQQRRNVSDPQVLADVAESEGFDRAEALAAIADDRLASTVAWEEDRAQEMMITGVPAVIVNGKMMIPGAQQPEVYVAALRQAVKRGL